MRTFWKHAAGWTGLILGLGVMISAAGAQADDQSLLLKHMPDAVRKTIQQKFPEARVRSVEAERKHGRTIYEVDLIQASREIELKLAADGSLLKIERDLDPSELPQAVTEAIQTHQFGTILRAEVTIRGDDHKYEVLVASDNQRFLEIELDAQGRILDVDHD